MAVFEALAIESGQAILDLGCGGGHLVREIALAVGDKGRAVGLDASAGQLRAAATLCDALAAVELNEGDATDMSFDDATFDGLASIQMLEYIPDVDRALAESRRVLKPGGKAALVSVLWDHWRFHGADQELTDRMLDIWRAHCSHQMLPLEMPRKLAAAGYGGVLRRPMAFFNGTMHENSFALWASQLVAAFATGKGIEEAEAALWLDQLSQADSEGRFGFVSVPVLTTAIAV
ncbi:MAG: methyltransferase domain-containing protein [Halocynthiibacter sp.]